MIKYYKETESNEVIAVFFNTLKSGILDIYSPTDKMQRATYNYIVNLPEAEKNEAKRMKKQLIKLGVIQ